MPGHGAMRFLALVAFAFAAPLAQSEESWVTLLKLQLADGYGCAVESLLYWRHVPTGHDNGTEGRVRCLDRREFNFTRPNEHTKFTIRLCQPAVC
jgi:hypothetical protein